MGSGTEEKDMQKTIKMIAENYRNLERSIVKQLQLAVDDHHLTTGTYRESVWRSLFEMIIPKKFCIDQGVFIIDSCGNRSREVDLAIYDEMYTPYIFNYGKIKFIPVEAVAVVVQCKSHSLEGLKKWVDAITELKTSVDSVVRIISGLADNEANRQKSMENPKETKHKQAQTATRPIRILCALKDVGGYVQSGMFDLGIGAGEKSLTIKFGSQEPDSMGRGDTLIAWHTALNHCKGREDLETFQAPHNYHQVTEQRTLGELSVQDSTGPNAILSLTFQLNQLLMLINNPMQFPHRAYANMFNTMLNNEKKEAEQ